MAKESPATREPLEKDLAEAKARRDELAGRWVAFMSWFLDEDELNKVRALNAYAIWTELVRLP